MASEVEEPESAFRQDPTTTAIEDGESRATTGRWIMMDIDGAAPHLFDAYTHPYPRPLPQPLSPSDILILQAGGATTPCSRPWPLSASWRGGAPLPLCGIPPPPFGFLAGRRFSVSLAGR